MKHLALFTILLLFLLPQAYAGNGSFLILKSAYLYQNSVKEGKKVLTRIRRAYDVVDLKPSQEDSMMFCILFPKEDHITNGSGYIVETEEELKSLDTSPVKVYAEMPSLDSDLTRYEMVPSNQLSFTGSQKISPDFPNLTWKAVNYKTDAPIQYWVPEWAGIYRPDKDAKWLNDAFNMTAENEMDPELVDKILMGIVETGFSKNQVRMALGDPMTERLIEDETKTEWIYSSRTIIFENNVVLRVL